MSNQCSNLFSYRSFNLFPPFHSPLKPHATTPRPVFPFHGNFILIGRRSRNSTSSLPPPLAAGSSSDVVLVATKEHHDGSLIFQFGDASEVVKIVEAVEEIESEAELESNAVKVVDGDKEIPVVEKTIEGEDEVADEITNADIAERETNVTNDLRDYEESVERLSPISEEEVIVSQSDVKSNESLEGVESMLDKTECTTQVGDNESLNPHISLLDNSLNRDMSADTKETLSKDGDDESEDQLVSVNLESIQPSDIEVMNVNPESTQPSYVEDELHNVETEDASESNTEDIMSHATMDIPDVELTDTANEDVTEELQDMDINEVTLIDEIPPSDPLGAESFDEVSEFQSVDVKIEATMEVSSTEAMDVKELAMENEVQEVSMNKINENDVAYLIPVSCTEEEEPLVEDEPQPTPVELQPGIHVSDIELNDTLTQDPDNEIVQTNDETEDPSVFVKLETMQVELVGVPQTDKLPKVEPEDTITSEMKDLPPQETMYISDAEIMDTVNEDMEEGLQDMNINDGTFIDEMLSSDLSEAEPTLDKVSQLQVGDVDFDVKDQPMEDELQQVSRDKNDEVNVDSVMPVTRIEETEQILEEEVTEPQLTPVELNPTMQVSDIELQDTMDQNLDEGILQVIDETEDPSESVKIEAMQVSETQVMDSTEPDMEDELPEVETEDTKESDVNYLVGPETILTSDVVLTEAVNEDVEEVLQDMNINEGTLIVTTSDEVSQLQPVPVILEATMEVLTTTEGMDVKDLCVEDELKQVSKENDVGYVMAAEPVLEEEVSEPCLTPVELKPTMEVSDIEVEDTGGQDLDDGILQVIDENADDSYIKEDELSLFQLEAELVQDLGVNHNMSEQCAVIDALGSSFLVEQGFNGSQLEAENIQGKVSSSELSEALEETAKQLATEAKVEREETYLTGYFLSSGAALLELPFKALTGGDDAYFVYSSKWLGVANGVSQWSFEGTIPGVYAHELMKTCEEIVSNKTSNVPITNPVQLLCKGVKETNMSGSSNILIANFNGQALHVANIGDTGFIIIRHGAVYKKSSPLLHEFHFALQVEDRDDPLQLVEEYIIELEEDDIIVSATDGLFDNLYEPEIAMVVTQSLQAGMKPEEVANVLATRAQEVGRSRFVRSPFSDAAQAAGYTGYIGGKQDNVAVIVSLVENRSSVVAD